MKIIVVLVVIFIFINLTDDFVTYPTPFIRCIYLLPHVTWLALTKKVAHVDVEDHHDDKDNKMFVGSSKPWYLGEYKYNDC